MSDKGNDKDAGADAKQTLAPEDIVTERSGVGRRSALSAAAAAVGAAVATVAGMRDANAQGVTDHDPNDPVGRGRGGYGGGGYQPPRSGVTDQDPNDPAGNGRGGGYRPPRSGVTDQDPNDPAGNGRGGGGYRPPPPPSGGVTDHDPNDPVGHGRGTGGYPGGGYGGYRPPPPPPPPPPQYSAPPTCGAGGGAFRYVITSPTAMRSGPARRAPLLTRLRPGEQITVECIDPSGFLRVNFSGLTGYVPIEAARAM